MGQKYRKTALLGRVICVKIFCVFDHYRNTKNPNIPLQSFRGNYFWATLEIQAYKQTEKLTYTQTENFTEWLKRSWYIKIYTIQARFMGLMMINVVINLATWSLCILQPFYNVIEIKICFFGNFDHWNECFQSEVESDFS